MIEAFANHLSSHLGRHLFYWAIDSTVVPPTGSVGLNLRLSELINKFHGPLERGVQVLDHLLTLEEDDFAGHWGSAYAHNYEPEYAARVPENQEMPPPEYSEYKLKILEIRKLSKGQKSKLRDEPTEVWLVTKFKIDFCIDFDFGRGQQHYLLLVWRELCKLVSSVNVLRDKQTLNSGNDDDQSQQRLT